VGRQHKQQLRHRSKLVMNSADIRATRPVRLLSRIHGRIKLISESSESEFISESDEVEDMVTFFRILSTMEPERNNFRCRKPSKDTEEQSYDWEYLDVVLHLTSQPCSTQISYTRSWAIRRGTGFDRFKKFLHWNTPKNTLILFSEKHFGVRCTLIGSFSKLQRQRQRQRQRHQTEELMSKTMAVHVHYKSL